MLALLIGLAVGLLGSRTKLGTNAYTVAANYMPFLPRP